ncbi:hypothetical protein QFC24_003577 [Naganishia onofrii]|uniref:Uncharacterized protein n=1 Tax=Naganishia onofrii TaxID=1851511 RepID=A0ACC2XJI4_9TREE|nr:hypothetical protein QFC24_003577 [Naganishia onofrii]
MVALDISETSKAIAIVGSSSSALAEALLALGLGIIVGPVALDWFSPGKWADSEEAVNTLTFEITRIVIGIQVLFTGIALPNCMVFKRASHMGFDSWVNFRMSSYRGVQSTDSAYIRVANLLQLECLTIAACVTPTDPVLANSICKGRFAEKYVPLHVRNIIVAESGANDGLGFPFLFMGIYLILRQTESHPVHTVGGAIGEWVYNILLYQILLSVVVGGAIGYVARVTLKWAEQRDLVDHDNFLAYGVGLTFLILGTVGLIGSDDILCCFVAGNAFTWDDWFRVQTEDHAFQDVIDTLLNSAIFLYIGSILPWSDFGGGFYGIQPWRLVVLGISVMVLRRVPWVVALHRWIPTLPTWRESAFAGFFGPIGVGAVFYVQVALEKLPEERERLRAAPTTLPTDQGLVDEHDVQAAAKVEVTDGMGENGSATPSRSASKSPSPDNMSLETPKTAIFPAADNQPEGIIRFQSTVIVDGHARSPSNLNGSDVEVERLTKRAKEIHGSLPT